MEPSTHKDSISPHNRLRVVTPLSKYLAMTIFIVTPFLAGWIGYEYGKLDLQDRSIGVSYVPPKRPLTRLESSQAPTVREEIVVEQERVVCAQSPCHIKWVGDMDTKNVGALVYVTREKIFEYSDGSIKGPYKNITFSTLELEAQSKDVTGNVHCDATYSDVLGSASISYKAVLEKEYYKQVADVGEANIHWSGNPKILHEAASTNESESPRNVLERPESFVVYSGPQATCSDIKEIQELQSSQLRSFKEAFAQIK